MVSHYCFNLHFPGDLGDGELFICLFSICVFGEVSVKVMAHVLVGLFIFLLLSFRSSLHSLDNSPLSDVSVSVLLYPFIYFIF